MTSSLLRFFVLSLALFACTARAQTPSDWLEPYPPFKIAGSLYYVGGKDLASYLITTPQGHILINSNLEANVPQIKASVEQLGFKFTDIKILLISQAHWDHCAGSAKIKELTGASYAVMEPDVSAVESGGHTDFHYASFPGSWFPATKVDRMLHDGDTVKLGEVELVARLTPGHTKGCTTWTMKVSEGGKTYDAVIIGGTNVNDGFKLINNPTYPAIAADYELCFRTLRSLPCDLFLGAHGGYFGMLAKRGSQKPAAASLLVDPEGYRKYVAEREQAFRVNLAKQEAAAKQ